MDVDWPTVFGLSKSPIELIVRGSATYWFLFLMFRCVLRRDVGSVAMADVLLLVIIADASQNAMAGEYKSVSDGAILISTIVGWNVLIDYATFRSERVRRLLEPAPLRLVRDGKVLHRNLRKEFMSMDDLLSKLREKGARGPEEVEEAYMESDGEISVIKKNR